ncbi:MAG: hypothetical protein ACU0CA_14085 [Paracoccaceae bacterium]
MAITSGIGRLKLHPEKKSVSLLCFGTHHKTGTKWIRGALKKISNRTGIPIHFRPSASDDWMQRVTVRPALVFSGSSRFPNALRNDSETHIVRMIRDPRDVLISGMRYHCKATDRHEKFLYAPRPDLGGLSYQEHLNNIESYEEKLLFEMDNHHDDTVQEMLSTDLDATYLTEWRYEDLISDHECSRFRQVFETLKIDNKLVEQAVRVFYRNSLFGGNRGGAAADGIHVSSGAPRQWKSQLPYSVAERYRDKYGDALIELGYEKDNNWLDKVSS